MKHTTESEEARNGTHDSGGRPPRLPSAGRLQVWKVRLRRLADFLKSMAKSPTTMIGAVVVTTIVLMALLRPSADARQRAGSLSDAARLGCGERPPGTPGHPLGTNAEGGDVLYGIVWGARLSIRLAFTVVGAVVVIGALYGSVAALLGGRWDEYMMRFVDVIQAIPELIFALAIAGTLGPSFRNIILALVVTMWPSFAPIHSRRDTLGQGNSSTSMPRGSAAIGVVRFSSRTSCRTS